MKRIGLAVGIVLLAFLATVTVGNHSVVRADMPPRVDWKAVPYGPVTLTGISSVTGVVLVLVTSLSFTAPMDGFVSVNSTGFCTFPPTNTISAVLMGWRTGVGGVFVASPGDAFFDISQPQQTWGRVCRIARLRYSLS